MVAAPIRAGYALQLKRRADVGGAAHVRTAAQIDPRALLIQGDRLGDRQILDQLRLIAFAARLEEGDGVLAVPDFPFERGIGGDDLAHPGLDGGEIGRGERRLAGEIVIEAVFDRWADGDLGAGV